MVLGDAEDLTIHNIVHFTSYTSRVIAVVFFG